MDCPVDGTTLERNTFHSIDVEVCPRCRGTWFDKGELGKAKDQAETDLSWLDFDIWSDQESFSTDWSSRKCPQCGKNMATISYGATGVAVDYCVLEHGVWLDKGEFETIIEALKDELSSKSASGYVKTSLEEAAELLSGDEGFISEWKDLRTVMRLLQYRVLVENPKVAELLTALQLTSPIK
jgi:Zn-finger nucleic acid-binding protein